jgi:AraC family transcriptional regulator, arabinose operon regulatory protein
MPGTPELYRVTIAAGETVMRRGRAQLVYRADGMDVWTINYTLRGHGRIGRDETSFTTRVGDLLLIPPGVRHDYGNGQGLSAWTHLWVCFFARPDWHEWMRWPGGSGNVLRLFAEEKPLRQRLVRLFRKVTDLVRSHHRRRDDLALNALEELLLWCDTINPLSTETKLDSRVREALACICARYHESLSVRDLSASCNLSDSRFSHLFREEMGCTPMQWLEQYRMQRARELLVMTGQPIAQIAREAGYDDPFYFSRIFRKHSRRTPRQFRQSGGRA